MFDITVPCSYHWSVITPRWDISPRTPR